MNLLPTAPPSPVVSWCRSRCEGASSSQPCALRCALVGGSRLAGRLAAVSLKRVSRRELTGVVDCECACESKRESHAQHRPDAEEGPADARVCVVLREWRLTAVPAVVADAALQREAEGGDRIPGAYDCNARTYSSKMSMIRKAESLARV